MTTLTEYYNKFNEDKYPQIINIVCDKVIPNCGGVESTPIL